MSRGWIRFLWELAGRHPDGTRHTWVRFSTLLTHACDGEYCHHYLARCPACGMKSVQGYSTPEVR